MMTININKKNIKDFIDFTKDPDVKETKKQDKGEELLLSYNTGETFLIHKDLAKQHGLISDTNLDDLIFGKDKTQNVVNVTVKDNSVWIYTETDGKIEVEERVYLPWILSPKPTGKHYKRLHGNQHYKYICHTDYNKYLEYTSRWQRNTWHSRTIEEGFLLLNGVSYFKGMKVNDVSILSTDIETTGVDKDASDAKVLLIANTFRKQGVITRKLFNIKDYSSEKEMLNDWCSWVNHIDPSVITGHNILGFDLPYMAERNSGLNIGRDGSAIRFDEKESKFRKDGSQQYGYLNARIHGREIIDTFFLSIKYDIGRQFPSYGLKPIVEHLGLEKEGRIKWDFGNNLPKDIIDNNELWKQFCEYAEDDADDAIKLFDLMIPSFFYLNQSVPKPFQQIINEATGSQLDAFMIRSYLQEGYSQPKTSKVESFDGAISMGIPGVYKNVIKWDVASLYPSIMLQYNISDKKKDPKNHMLQALDYFRTQRLEDKRLGQETGDKYYKDLDASRKIIINSLYGFMGANYLLYNFVEGAAEVTKHGREILQKGVEWATGHRLKHVIKKITNKGKENEKKEYEWVLGDKISFGRGYSLVNTDTDSFSVTKGEKLDNDIANSELDNLNSIYEDLIVWEPDGEFDDFIVIQAKNYVMNENGKVKYKGSGLKDQKKEPALKEMLLTLLDDIMFNKSNRLQEIYQQYINEAMNIKDISRWAVKKTITENLLEANDTTKKKILAAIENTNYNVGDKIWLYSAIDGEIQDVKKGEPVFYKKTGEPKMIPNKVLRMQSEWSGDENKMHYVERVYKTLMILENLLDKDQFIDYSKKSNYDQLMDLIKE